MNTLVDTVYIWAKLVIQVNIWWKINDLDQIVSILSL